MDSPNENVSDSKSLLHYKEKSWSNWIKEVTESRVYRLPYQDMSLYGVRPEMDTFSAVICSTCGAVVKAPALKRHIELRHPEDTQAFVAPKQVPVKKSRPNILRKPSKSPVPAENAVVCTSTNAQATENNTTSTVQSIVAVKPELSTVTASTKTSSVLLVKPALSVSLPSQSESPVARRKSPPNNERKRTRDKDKETDVDKSASSQESSSSARTTPKQLQKRNNTSSDSGKSTVRSTSSSSSVKSSSKQSADKYVKKSSNVTIWGRPEETEEFHMIYPNVSTVSSSNPPDVSNVFVLANGQQTSSVRCNVDVAFSNKNYSATSTTVSATNASEWSNNHIEKMVCIQIINTCYLRMHGCCLVLSSLFY